MKLEAEIGKMMENAFDNNILLEIEEEFCDVHKSSTSVCEASKFYEHFWKIVSLKMSSIDNNSEAPITNSYFAFKFVFPKDILAVRAISYWCNAALYL